MGAIMIDVHHHEVSSNGVPTEGQRVSMSCQAVSIFQTDDDSADMSAR